MNDEFPATRMTRCTDRRHKLTGGDGARKRFVRNGMRGGSCVSTH